MPVQASAAEVIDRTPAWLRAERARLEAAYEDARGWWARVAADVEAGRRHPAELGRADALCSAASLALARHEELRTAFGAWYMARTDRRVASTAWW